MHSGNDPVADYGQAAEFNEHVDTAQGSVVCFGRFPAPKGEQLVMADVHDTFEELLVSVFGKQHGTDIGIFVYYEAYTVEHYGMVRTVLAGIDGVGQIG